jgi:predicted glutamine amidotransferase
MCIIIWSPEGSIPREHVVNAMLCHQDGWGFAVATGKRVVTYKTTNFKDFLKAWFERVDGPVMLHARRASHGRVNKANCHPFRMKHHPLVVAHNGIIPRFGHDTLSDTRDFIDKVLEPMPSWFLEDEEIREVVSRAIGMSKMLFLQEDASVTILNEHLGTWFEGRWYSNFTAFEEQ